MPLFCYKGTEQTDKPGSVLSEHLSTGIVAYAL